MLGVSGALAKASLPKGSLGIAAMQAAGATNAAGITHQMTTTGVLGPRLQGAATEAAKMSGIAGQIASSGLLAKNVAGLTAMQTSLSSSVLASTIGSAQLHALQAIPGLFAKPALPSGVFGLTFAPEVFGLSSAALSAGIEMARTLDEPGAELDLPLSEQGIGIGIGIGLDRHRAKVAIALVLTVWIYTHTLADQVVLEQVLDVSGIFGVVWALLWWL